MLSWRDTIASPVARYRMEIPMNAVLLLLLVAILLALFNYYGSQDL